MNNSYEKAPQWYQPFLKFFDEKNLTTILQYLANDCVLIVGGRPPVEGKNAIKEVYQIRWPMLKGSQHHVLRSWQLDDVAIVQGEVTWTKLDNQQVVVPFMHLIEHKDNLLKKIHVFIDNKPIYG